MKIYLLMLLIGTLLTAIHFTSRRNSDRRRFRSRAPIQGLSGPSELQGIASGNTPFPARISATCLLGID